MRDIDEAGLEELPAAVEEGVAAAHNRERNDVEELGLLEKRNLMHRLLENSLEGHASFLLKQQQRLQRVGLELPSVEVRFSSLNVEVDAYVASRALPTVYNFMVNSLEGALSSIRVLKSSKKPFPILQGLSGVIKPGRMTLLLGPPGSGKTTLLSVLSVKPDPKLKVSGSVTYNDHETKELESRRTSAYISQHDVHFAQMTVRETLAFAARCQGVGTRHEMLVELLKREKEANITPDPDIDAYMKAASREGVEESILTDYIIKILGLESCADTLVGDEMNRGISGGQRRLLTLGEMMVGPARAFFMDEITNGLDSSRAFQVVKAIKEIIHVQQGTALISLNQPTPEIYDLFDDIILLSDGKIVYQGPCGTASEFFESMGFKCPERKGFADFLQEVTSKGDQRQYWCNKEQPYQYVSVNMFSEAFLSSHIGKTLENEPVNNKRTHPMTLSTKQYSINKRELLKACAAREYLLMKRSSFIYIFNVIKLIILGTIFMTVFWRGEMHKDTILDGIVYLGALYCSMTFVMFNALQDFVINILRLPMFYKQRDMLFFPAWAYVLAQWILKLPVAIYETTILVSLTYYSVGYDPAPERFLKHWLAMLLISQVSGGMLQLIAALTRDLIIGNTVGPCVVLTFLVTSGFILSRDDIRKWWYWGYWSSPNMYAQTAISVNEFLGKSWSHVPNNSSESLGVLVLKYRGIFPEAHWYWIGVAALIGYTLLSNFLAILGLTYLNPFWRRYAVLSQEKMNIFAEENMNSGSMPNIDPKRKRGMILPFEPLWITFEKIHYAIDMPKELKKLGIMGERIELLKDINGAFRPGVLTAIMGATGTGKTTLLDVLAGRKTGGYVQGTIKISGYLKNQETFARISGYCEQTNIHTPHVTVYESLQFSAWLRLPPNISVETRKIFIDEVLELLELTTIKDALVGLPGVNGLSIEQRKRLTTAVELVANPSILFMDEPTSGLDARAAAVVMRTVRSVVETGRTAVCTIHQPSIDIFDTFDELLLLKSGGEEIYVGPLGKHSCELINYFQGIQGVNQIRYGYNPSTWMMEMTSPSHEKALGVDYAHIYKNSELYEKNKQLIKQLSAPPPNSKELNFPTSFSQSFQTQCIACLWKQTLSHWRNPPYTAVNMLFTSMVTIIIGTAFWGLGSHRSSQQDIFNAIGAMSIAVQFIGQQNSMTVQPVIATNRIVYYRERAAGLYSSLPYALGQAVAELPYILVQTLVYGVLVYSMIGFEWMVQKFFWFFFFMFLTFLYCTLLGMMVVAMTPNLSISTIVLSFIYTTWSLFSGFLIPITRIPRWWRWYYYLAPYSWTLNALVSSQFGDVQSGLDSNETVAEFVHDYFGFRHDFLGYIGLIMVGVVLVFGIVFAFSIKIFNFQKR